jgi:hypothetical protein
MMKPSTKPLFFMDADSLSIDRAHLALPKLRRLRTTHFSSPHRGKQYSTPGRTQQARERFDGCDAPATKGALVQGMLLGYTSIDHSPGQPRPR